jgi:hypothetical protein
MEVLDYLGSLSIYVSAVVVLVFYFQTRVLQLPHVYAGGTSKLMYKLSEFL